MSREKPFCVVEYFGAANQGVDEALSPAREMVDAGKANEVGQFVVSCERCGADFALTTRIGSPTKMVLLTSPKAVSERNCAETSYRQEGDWIMNLNGSAWFPVDVLLDALNQDETSLSSEGEPKPDALPTMQDSKEQAPETKQRFSDFVRTHAVGNVEAERGTAKKQEYILKDGALDLPATSLHFYYSEDRQQIEFWGRSSTGEEPLMTILCDAGDDVVWSSFRPRRIAASETYVANVIDKLSDIEEKGLMEAKR
jgi:hypothetical protein